VSENRARGEVGPKGEKGKGGWRGETAQ